MGYLTNKSVDEDELSQLEELSAWQHKYQSSDFPLVSILVPTCNSAHIILPTIESILQQDYPNFELIILDCSDDRTVEIVRSLHSDKIRIYSGILCNRYELLNQAASFAKGRYFSCLFPGDFYISPDTIRLMMTVALDHSMPHMVYCGTLLRDAVEEVKILCRKLTIDLLKNGQQPTSLQSCWFRTDIFNEIGRFNPNYTMRGGFELLCRLYLRKGFRFAASKRVLTDYDLRTINRKMIIAHFWETGATVYRYFGFWAMLKWLFRQKDLNRYINLWLHSLRVVFSGRR